MTTHAETHLSRIAECFRLFCEADTLRESSASHDAMCEFLHEHHAEVDPDWKRPACLGPGPSAAARRVMDAVIEGGGE